VEGIQALMQWPEAFGFAVLGGGLVALGRLCRKHDSFPASLGALAYLEALLLLGIAVTGLPAADRDHRRPAARRRVPNWSFCVTWKPARDH
jgi:hypothetical protein